MDLVKDLADETRVVELEMKELFIMCYRRNKVVRLELSREIASARSVNASIVDAHLLGPSLQVRQVFREVGTGEGRL